MKKALFIFLLILACFLLPGNVFATNVPEFPSCSNPQGDLKISYVGGEHQIVGETTLRSGSDAVYFINGYDALLQCFCPSGGDGIQSVWWKIGDMCEEDIESYVNSGWIFVSQGTDWGLAEGSYLAKNTSYSCGGAIITPTPSGGFQLGGPPICTADRPEAPQLLSVVREGSYATINWTKVDKATHYTISYGTSSENLQYGVWNTGNVISYKIGALDPNQKYYFTVYAVNDCMPSLPSTTTPSGGVLGLAATGNLTEIYSLLSFGAFSVVFGLALRKKSR
ncbi:hypothetical protein A2159_00345 [Candidatus Woesebacteria bacterium RBG_13_34_9]|uniref:Fibronectin type-III domain-containing protein n=1 Tax=Candidatus Woesebacteria bacterium RBG_13_34_9 TaxID=1802477 RepID=A0A1F7X4L5_9BACT|nr:MAG: hypothetical protein A2159_00345 [Candidatus Woesebacteria bacterium RBG_13_34_9]